MGLPHISPCPDGGCSKPAMMRSNVDLPQPDAPIRQMNSPLWMVRLAPDSALIGWACSLKNFETSLISTIGVGGLTPRGMVASAMIVGAPAQQAVADRHDH